MKMMQIKIFMDHYFKMLVWGDEIVLSHNWQPINFYHFLKTIFIKT